MTCDKVLRFWFFSFWVIAAACSLGILSTYSVIGTAHIVEFLKLSNDGLGSAFLVVTLYVSQWVLTGYILITSLQWFISFFGDEIMTFVNWIRKFRLTRIPEDKGDL